MTLAKTSIALCVLALLALGCRLEPGATDYASQQPGAEVDDNNDDVEFLPGPDPFIDGERRLFFGPFYEGGFSDALPIDDVTSFFFVFNAGGNNTLDIINVSDRIEGFGSDALIHTGQGFWGISLAFFTANPDDGGVPRAEDLSTWDTLHISLKSSDPTYAEVGIGMASLGGEETVGATNYGYTNDGEWHSIEIPLSDLSAVDTSEVITPLIISGAGGSSGETLLVDGFYLTAGGE